MNAKQLTAPVERGCDSEGYLEIVNGLFDLALGLIYMLPRT